MMRADVANYMIVCSLVILLLLVILFRRFSGVFIPVVMVFATLMTTFGCMAFFDFPFSMSVQMLPIIVMCVVVCDVIHVLVLVYQALADGKEKEDAIAYAYRHSGLAILMTSLTTAAGFAAFISADLAPIGHLGILSSTGVLLAFLYSVTLLPALIAILPMRQVAMKNSGTGEGIVVRALLSAGDLATQKPWHVTIVSLVFLGWCIVGASQVRFSHEPTKWFPKDHEVRKSLELIDSKLSGSQTIEILVDTGRVNGLYEPDVLRRFESLMRFSESLRYQDLYVGKAVSISDVVKETHQALNDNQPAYYVIPDDRALVAQELLLFLNTGSDDLEIFTDNDFQTGRLSLRIPMVDSVQYAQFFSALEKGMGRILGDELSYQITGIAPVFGRTFVGMIHSMGKSYMIAFAIITPLMILLVGNFRLGIVSMIPNLVPVIAVLGIMGWFDLSLDVSTVVIGSILIGLAVDDTIHFFHRFQRYFAESADVNASVSQTMETTGSALVITSLVLGSGFLSIGMMGTMLNTVTFGLLTAVGIAIAFFADILISPAIIKLVVREHERSPRTQGLEVSGDTIA
jgi:predicted RND superfamily exporter protein